MFQARDALGNPQPITTSPVASLNPRYPQVLGTMVFFATGELLGVPDLADVNVQTIYGIYDPPATYATPLTSPVREPRQHPRSAIAVTCPASNGQVVVDTGNAVTIPTNKGWYVDLTLNSGERVVTDPRLESGGTLVLTSYVPSTNVCSAGGSSFLYMLNLCDRRIVHQSAIRLERRSCDQRQRFGAVEQRTDGQSCRHVARQRLCRGTDHSHGKSGHHRCHQVDHRVEQLDPDGRRERVIQESNCMVGDTSMKLAKIGFAAAALAMVLCSRPEALLGDSRDRGHRHRRNHRCPLRGQD